MKSRTLLLSAALVAAGLFVVGPASAQTKIKFMLDWKYQGPQGWYFLAQDRGYFKAEGLEVTFDQGEGAAAAVSKVASGAYDIGSGSFDSLVNLASQRPDEAPVAVYAAYNRPPFSIVTRMDSPINTPKDLEGKAVGAPINDGAFKLFPAFAQLTGIDRSKVKITNMQPNLREQMLMRGQVDAVFGFGTVIAVNAKLMGIDPAKQLRFINYGDYGMDIYAVAIIVSKKLAQERPEIVRGFLRALNRGIVDTLADRDSAVHAVLKREPLLKFDLEKERLNNTIERELSHSEIGKIGMGDVDDARLNKTIDVAMAAYQLTRKPALETIFSRAFLPPRAERPSSIPGLTK